MTEQRLWTAWVSDLHVGGAFSIWPPGFIGSAGVKLNLNDGQAHLWTNWQTILRAVRTVTGGHLHILGVVGDTVDGKQKKEEGQYVVEPDMTYQARAAVDILQPLRDMADRVYVLRGSKYHVGAQSESEEWVAEMLDARRDPLYHRVWKWIPHLDVGGVVLDVGHSQSSTIINRTMPLEREIRFAYQVADMKGMPDLIIRAHAHIGTFITVDGQAALGLMPMQLQSAYAETSRWPNRWLTRWLGISLVEILPERLGTMWSPFNVHSLRFRHPDLAREVYVEGEGRKSWMQFLRTLISR